MATDFEQIKNGINSGSVIPFDQPEIEAVMKKIMLENGITDVLYEGSNISQLSSVISYIISSLNINTAINLQETILPLATKRMNILFGARQLGYEPHKRKSFKYKIFLTPQYDQTKLNPEGQVDTLNKEKRQIGLKRNTVFVSGGNKYYYRGDDIPVIFEFSNYDIHYKDRPDLTGYPTEAFYYEIEVVEGEFLSHNDYPELNFFVDTYTDKDGKIKVSQEFLIPFKNVEDDGIDVIVESPDYSDILGGYYNVKQTLRTRSKQFLIDETFTYDKNKFIRQENIILEYPVIFFEYNGMGEPVNVNDKILVDILISSGKDGEADGDFSVQDSVYSTEVQVVNTLEDYLPVISQYGSDGESDENIKQNALSFNNTANRAVTKLDYIAITKREPNVKEADAWGGEDEIYPPSNSLQGTPMLGHVWVSTVPYYNKEYTYYRPEGIEDPVTGLTNWTLEKYELNIGSPTIDNEPLKNLYNWYQSGSEIVDPATGSGTGNIGQIIDWLNFYKIITMKVHHRHPLYIDFDFVCDIVKYDLTKSRQEVNKEIFNAINDYFEAFVETFGSEYINSNLERVLDSILSFQSGIGFTVKLKGVLFKEMTDETTGKIHCSLAFPFEDIYTAYDPNWTPSNPNKPDEGYLDTTLLPKIDTLDFGALNGTISVDYSSLNYLNLGNQPNGSTDINYVDSQTGTPVSIGRYTVRKDLNEIQLEFDFNSAGVEDNIFNETLPDGSIKPVYARFDIEYPFTNAYNRNIPFTRNTIPRLRKVEFKDN